MKKRFVVMLSFLLVFSTTGLCNAKDTSSYDCEQQLYDTVNNNPSQYGGYYYEGNVLHIVPYEYAVNLTVLNDEVNKEAKNAEIDIVYDEPVKYSYAELDKGYYILIDHWDELELKELTVDVETNSILAGAVKWTDESKEKAKKYSGIENIDFYISDGVIEGTYEESDDIFPESPTNRTINFSRYGYRIEDASQTDSSGSVNSLKSTLGAIAQYKNDNITTNLFFIN
jgi:hypothetical protein